MKKSSWLVLLALLLILCSVGYVAWQVLSKPADTNSFSAAAQVFTGSSTANFTDFAGNDAHLEQHLDSVIVAHAWATWVPTSPAALRDLSLIQAEYRDRDVVVLAINRGEPGRTARQFLDQLAVTNLTLVADREDQYFSSVGGTTMPETIFYDRTGNVVYHKRGPLTIDELRLHINQALRADSSP